MHSIRTAKPVITFDCDGVFANFTKAWTGLINQACGSSYTDQWPTYDVVGSYIPKEHWEAGAVMATEDPFFLMGLEPYPDVPFRKIEAMMSQGVITGYVVSVRTMTDDPAGQTRVWLNERGLYSLQGAIVGTRKRADVLKILGSEAHLDDAGYQVEALQKEGLNAYLLDRPWNQDAQVDPKFRVSSVDEFLERAVGPLLPEEEAKFFFSPPQVTDLVSPNCDLTPFQISSIVRDTGFSVAAIPESYGSKVTVN